MAFRLPNKDGVSNFRQAEPDEVDIDILVAGFNASGIVSGCVVTAQGTPDLTVAVASGTIIVDGTVVDVTGANATIGTADATHPRFDLITVNNSGTIATTAGTAAAEPDFPQIPANSVVLAAIYIAANETTIETNKIVDKRVLLDTQVMSSGVTLLQSTANYSLVWADPAAARTLTIPAVSGDRSFSFIDEAETLSAVKTFSAEPVFQNNIAVALGTGSDSRIFYDNADTIWDLQAVGTGGLMLALGDSFPSPDRNAIHIWAGDAGDVTARPNTLLTLEAANDVRLVFLSPNTNFQAINFGDPESNLAGQIKYDHATDEMEFGTDGTIRFILSATALAFQQATSITTSSGNLILLPTGDVVIPDNTAVALGTGLNSRLYHDGTDTIWDLQAVGTGSLMLALASGFPSPVRSEIVHLWKGTAGGGSVSSASIMVLEDSEDTFITFLSPTNKRGGFLFADAGGVDRGVIRYTHSSDRLEFGAGGALRMLLTATSMDFQQDTVVSAVGTLTFTSSGGTTIFTDPLRMNDNGGVIFGTTSDIRMAHRVTGVAANLTASSIIIGTPIHQGFANNSVLLSAVTDNADLIFLVIDGATGNSHEFMLADSSLDLVTLGHGMGTTRIASQGDVNLDPAADVQMGADVFIEHDTNAGLTAGTTQTQADGLALTTEINEVATVANANDTVVLPLAAAGRRVTVINNGDNTLRMYPAVGDNLGAGVDVFEELEMNESIDFVAYDATNWHVVASTEIFHAEMFDIDNGTAFQINHANDDHGYHSSGMQTGDLAGWSFDAGSGSNLSIAIASIADGAASGVDIAVTTGEVHNLSTGDIVVHSDSTNLANSAYEGYFVVKAIISTTIYEVAAVFTADGTGFTQQPASLKCDVGSGGQYLVSWAASAAIVGVNDLFDFAIHIQTAHISSTNTRRFFSNNDVGSLSGVSIITIADGDQVSWMIRNTTDAGNMTIRDLTLVLVRL